MKRILVFLILSVSIFSRAQYDYRFSINGGFHSFVFTGFRSFDNIVCPTDNDVYKIYQTEVYDLDYRNFSSSVDYSFGFSVNWINNEKWMLSQSVSFFKGNLNDGLKLTLTDIGDGSLSGSPTGDFNSSNTGVGSVANISSNSEIYGYSTALVLYKDSKVKNLRLGAGIYYNLFVARDFWWHGSEKYLVEVYRPSFGYRGSGSYNTKQIGISLNLIYSWKFISYYLNLGNSFITTKKESEKGNFEWADGYPIFPTSHNFDYRFPLTIETGIALSFDRIKKEEK